MQDMLYNGFKMYTNMVHEMECCSGGYIQIALLVHQILYNIVNHKHWKMTSFDVDMGKPYFFLC
jgi:hypothetical protein